MATCVCVITETICSRLACSFTTDSIKSQQSRSPSRRFSSGFDFSCVMRPSVRYILGAQPNCCSTYTVITRVNAPLTVNAPGRHCLRKRATSGLNAPSLSKPKCDKRPGFTVNAPPVILGGKRPSAKLARHFECGRWSCFRSKQRRALRRKLDAWDMGSYNVLRSNSKTDKVRRGQRNKHVLDVLAL